MTAATYTKTGTKATTATKLEPSIYGLTVKNHELLKQAYVAYQGNGRINLALTKSRGLVRGGGRKPWRQKGTGRARFGSSRNPIWRGGGVVFGPTGQENYTKKVNSRSNRLALRQALSLAAEANKLKIIEAFELKDAKAASAAKLLNKLGCNGSVLVVTALVDESLKRATNNLPKTKLIAAKYLNVVDVLDADTILLDKQALAVTQERLKEAK
jgi:large subunit ribosomal protein L4